MSPHARTIGSALDSLVAAPLPVRVTAYDGSATGRTDSGIRVHLASPRALRYVLSAPGISGWPGPTSPATRRSRGASRRSLRAVPAAQGGAVRAADAAPGRRSGAGLGWRSFTPPPPPSIELLPRWRRALESLREPAGRRAAAVKAHYDLNNDFYERLLGPSMAYTCGVYTSPQDTLEDAQERKFELVFRKLGLRPGMRLLDVGCGWGGMMRTAARHGVEVTGVTLSGYQADWVEAMLAREGLADRTRLWRIDYRSMPHEQFDAVSLIGMLEHMGCATTRRTSPNCGTASSPEGGC